MNPSEAPQTGESPPKEPLTFSLGGSYADVAVIFFIATIAITIIDTIELIVGWELVTAADLETLSFPGTAIALLFTFIQLGTVAAFIAWLFHVRKNLPALGIEKTSWGTEWTIVGWFIPIANFYCPYSIVKEVWKASAPKATPDSWYDAPTPNLVKWWWAFFTLTFYITPLFIVLNGSLTEEYDAMKNAETSTLFFLNVFTMIGSVLAILVVKEINRRQIERRACLQKTSI